MHIKCTLFAGIAILLFSCTSTKNIQTARVNTDSLVTHVKDSMSQVHTRETTELRRMLEEMTSSGVTFVVDSCPERDAVLALLDSSGKERYKALILAEKVRELSSKVTISERGAITAEGRIKEAKFTNTKLQDELLRTERTIDQLTKENDSLRAQKTTVVETKDKQVKRKSLFGSYAMAFGAGAFCMLLFLWWFNRKRSSNNINMKTTSLLILLASMTLTSCGKFSDGTSIWAEGLWIIPVLMFLGGAWFLYLAYRASKSNSNQQTTGGTKDNTGNVPIYKVGKFWIGVALVVLTIIVMLHQSAQK